MARLLPLRRPLPADHPRLSGKDLQILVVVERAYPLRREPGGPPRFVTTREAREFAAYLRTPLAFRWGQPVPPPKQSLSPVSVSSYGRSVKVFFNWLEREEHIKLSPFNKSVHFTNRHRQDRVIKSVEEADLARLFGVLTRPERLATYLGCRDLAVIALLVDSGIRLGELLSIRTSDLDLAHNRCQVRGKTGQRYALFSETCRTALVNYLHHPKRPSQNPGSGEEATSIWLTGDGLALSYYGLESIIRRLKKESGVNFHAHRLRHTFASLMAQKGVSVFDLKELLGHTSITTTQIYVQQNIERLAEVHRPNSPLAGLALGEQLKRRPGRPRKER
ncbi:MAG TPA: site-specific integrase [Chloroflexia bacterium]|nr:site-specific integrase [Chloroflexia bacterium]